MFVSRDICAFFSCCINAKDCAMVSPIHRHCQGAQIMGHRRQPGMLPGILLLFSVLLPAGIFAQQSTLTWVEGPVQIIRGDNSGQAQIGDELNINAELVLGEGASVEIDADGTRILITAPGQYALRRFVGLSDSGHGLLSSLARRVSVLNAPEGEQGNSDNVAGVRGNQTDSDEIEWAVGGTGDLFQEGFEQLSAGQVDQAYYSFEQAYFTAADADFPEAAFYLGYAAALRGDVQEARELYDEAAITPDQGGLFVLYTLSNADLLLKLNDYAAVIDRLQLLFDNDSINPEDLQLAHYYRAMAYASLGDMRSRNADLHRVTEINIDRQLTALAEEILWAE